MMQRCMQPRTRRGTAVIVAIWATAIAAIAASAIMLFAFRQAYYGREAVARVKARWAARAGLENMISAMARDNLDPIPDDAFSLIRDMENLSSQALLGASYDIQHHRDGVNWRGPLDEHSKLSLNDNSNLGYFTLLDDVTPDITDALVDWTDENEDVSTFGVERDYYQQLTNSYEPRNGPLRSTVEMELVAGMWPEYVRGEDWNMNGRLDANENDGMASPPEDDADGIMRPAWGQLVTVHSRGGGYGSSGQERLNLRLSRTEDVVERLGVTEEKAEALLAFATLSQPLERLITSSLSSLVGGTNGISADDDGDNNTVERNETIDLSDSELRLVLADCSVDDPRAGPPPGRLNINTVSESLLRQMFSDESTEYLADELLYLRNSRSEGVTSLVDLRDIPNITDSEIDRLAQQFDVRSNVFMVSSVGRAETSGLTVEIVAIVDRSTLPVKILEYREQ